MSKQWTVNEVLQIASGYQGACILGAAADLDLFPALAGSTFTAEQAAARLSADVRATKVLLDALAAMEFLDKTNGLYQVPPTVVELLTPRGSHSVLAMAQHQANCLRRWSQLASTVKTGKPAEREASIRGESADYAAFVEAMDNISGPMAPKLVGEIQPLAFRHLLDVGGASGTWTIAFLRRMPEATATIFDLPHVIPQARERLSVAGMTGRVKLAGGDYMKDPLPTGADLAWVSAIVHSLSRQQNRKLFASVFKSLADDGQILIRDYVMEASRTVPVGGALFAVNMLSATEGGGTFTFDELREDLKAAGFVDVSLLRDDRTMNSLVSARKP